MLIFPCSDPVRKGKGTFQYASPVFRLFSPQHTVGVHQCFSHSLGAAQDIFSQLSFILLKGWLLLLEIPTLIWQR